MECIALITLQSGPLLSPAIPCRDLVYMLWGRGRGGTHKTGANGAGCDAREEELSLITNAQTVKPQERQLLVLWKATIPLAEMGLHGRDRIKPGLWS